MQVLNPWHFVDTIFTSCEDLGEDHGRIMAHLMHELCETDDLTTFLS